MCRTVVCYRIEENGDDFDRESYLLMREPVCDYSKDPIDESVILWWRVHPVNVIIVHTVYRVVFASIILDSVGNCKIKHFEHFVHWNFSVYDN